MSAIEGLPWRGPGPGRPELPLPPDPMPIRRDGSWRKSWRYVGAFCDELFIVAAAVKVGPIGQTFWAIVDRSSGKLYERTRTRLPRSRGEVWTERDGRLITRVEARGVSATLGVGEGRWAESVCPTSAGSYVWTRKRVGAPISYEVEVDGRHFSGEAYGVEDESAGYHPNPTEWYWSAGVGTSADGRPVGWNLVSGINDPPRNSERAVWVDGEPHEPGPVSFDPELGGIAFDDGSALAFSPEAERTASQNLGLLAYDYRQPFGVFSGELDGITLASGIGVMEYHLARW